MAKSVVVIASGETERRALPYLLASLRSEGIALIEVRIPPRGHQLSVDMAEKLIKASWFERQVDPPRKFVVLMDTDGRSCEDVLRPFREKLKSRIANITAHLQFACAQRHLEAWYFADPAKLKAYLDRDLGNVDLSQPDQIENPKLHLKHLLRERAYTAVVSEEMARCLDPKRIEERSESFQTFVNCVRNGQSPLPTS